MQSSEIRKAIFGLRNEIQGRQNDLLVCIALLRFAEKRKERFKFEGKWYRVYNHEGALLIRHDYNGALFLSLPMEKAMRMVADYASAS